MTIRGPIPEHIRRLMSPEDRADMGKAAMTNEDAQASRSARRERELQENIASLLRQRNIWFSRQRMDKRSTTVAGCPDFLFSVKGRACAFEVKTDSGRVTDEQRKCHEEMVKNGWLVFVVRSLPFVQGILNGLQE